MKGITMAKSMGKKGTICGPNMLTGEIDRPSTERVEPVRGCLITQAVWDEPP
jgi:hypothetical protein